MNNEEARQILGTYRPGGADAGDPLFEDALRQARRDPELKQWFANERRFDGNFAEALQSIEAPREGKTTLFASARAEPRSRTRRFPLWTGALAAAFLLTTGLLFAWLTSGLGVRGDGVLAGDGSFGPFVEMTASAMPFDHRADSVPELSAWLEQRGVPFPAGLPGMMAEAGAVGCQVFEGVDGREISLLCLVVNGEFVHLFVTDETAPAFAQLPKETWHKENGWNAYSWNRAGRGYIALSRAPRDEFTTWFREV